MRPSRTRRHKKILDLVERQRIRSQAELARRLERLGHSVTQATLSRDLRELGVRKGPQGYELSAGAAPPPGNGLARSVQEFLLEAAPAHHQVVLRTPPGGAQPLAAALDHAGLRDVLGTLAGDDTVLVVCASPAAARRTCKELLELAGGQGTER